MESMIYKIIVRTKSYPKHKVPIKDRNAALFKAGTRGAAIRKAKVCLNTRPGGCAQTSNKTGGTQSAKKKQATQDSPICAS